MPKPIFNVYEHGDKAPPSSVSVRHGEGQVYDKDLQLLVFRTSNPQNWANVVDELFRLRGIDSQDRKFAMASLALPDDVVGKIPEIFGCFSVVDRYDVLKLTLIECLQSSAMEKYEALFDEVQFAGLSPGETLREIRLLAGRQAFDDILFRCM